MDLSIIIDAYEEADLSKRRSRFCSRVTLPLFQTMMVTGAVCIAKKHLIVAGYGSRREAYHTLFKRVRLLHEFNYNGKDEQYATVQSLVLISYWSYSAKDDFKNNRYWLSIALSLAYKLQLQRDPATYLDSVGAQRHRKRIWWALVVADQIISLGSKLPSLTNINDAHVPMSCVADFLYGNDNEERVKYFCSQSLGITGNLAQQRQHAVNFIHRAQLSYLILQKIAAARTPNNVRADHSTGCWHSLLHQLNTGSATVKQNTDSYHQGDNRRVSRISKTDDALTDLLYYSCVFSVYETSARTPKNCEQRDCPSGLYVAYSDRIKNLTNSLKDHCLPCISNPLFLTLAKYLSCSDRVDSDTAGTIRSGVDTLQFTNRRDEIFASGL